LAWSAASVNEIQRELTRGFPSDIAGLEEALLRVREYTLALYADLPAAWWSPASFPCLKIVNPPLWELSHIAWFAEFFCLRWQPDDLVGSRIPCALAGGDRLFDSAKVAHATRWILGYPSHATCLDYMRSVLGRVIEALHVSGEDRRYFFQLALAHEAMHAEALAMTLNTLLKSLPACVPLPRKIVESRCDVEFAAGDVVLGGGERAFRFDNEQPALEMKVESFFIDSRVITEAEFAEFAGSPAYTNDEFWSAEGSRWRAASTGPARRLARADQAAMHVSFYEAEAWCRWARRRLPTEAEWEFAVGQSAELQESTGIVWEWTSTPFAGYPGFEPGPYRDYSAPWFGDHTVLKGASFATNALLRYPQYRNFYQPSRSDMFCGFRSCGLS
jgi:ergothioneine biosynthesis protein EgtB